MLVKGHMEIHRIVYTHLALVRPDVVYQRTKRRWSSTRPTRALIVRVPDWGHDFCPQCAWAGRSITISGAWS